jgi:hypothetical protein
VVLGVLGVFWGLFPSFISEVSWLISEKKSQCSFQVGSPMGNLPETLGGPCTLQNLGLEDLGLALLRGQVSMSLGASPITTTVSGGRSRASLVIGVTLLIEIAMVSSGMKSSEPLGQRLSSRICEPQGWSLKPFQEI